MFPHLALVLWFFLFLFSILFYYVPVLYFPFLLGVVCFPCWIFIVCALRVDSTAPNDRRIMSKSLRLCIDCRFGSFFFRLLFSYFFFYILFLAIRGESGWKKGKISKKVKWEKRSRGAIPSIWPRVLIIKRGARAERVAQTRLLQTQRWLSGTFWSLS